MSSESDIRSPWDEPGVFDYFVVCLGALGALLLLLLQRDFGVWSMVPVLVGLIGGATRFGPLLLALAVAMTINSPPVNPSQLPSHSWLDVPDLILCGAVLIYAIAHYRLQGLLVYIFPPDPRRPSPSTPSPILGTLRRRLSTPLKQRRAAHLVTRQEVGIAILTMPAWAALAQIGFRLFPRNWGNPGLLPHVWDAVVAAWLIGLLLLLVSTIIRYWYRQQITAEEGLVFLQDTLWRETRREQRRINRWLAWSKLRSANAKEQS